MQRANKQKLRQRRRLFYFDTRKQELRDPGGAMGSLGVNPGIIEALSFMYVDDIPNDRQLAGTQNTTNKQITTAQGAVSCD